MKGSCAWESKAGLCVYTYHAVELLVVLRRIRRAEEDEEDKNDSFYIYVCSSDAEILSRQKTTPKTQ